MCKSQTYAEEASGDHRSNIRPVEISLLKGHERLNQHRLMNLMAEIKSDGVLKKPITVDMNANVVLDGHHRIGVLKLLGCSRIPALFVDYQSARIGVKTGDKRQEYPKSKVIEAAVTGKLLRPKSTWHYVAFSSKAIHISELQRRVDIPLTSLK